MSSDLDTTLLELTVAVAAHGCEIQNKEEKNHIWISRLVMDQKIFRGVLSNIQARAGVASLAKQIQIVQD